MGHVAAKHLKRNFGMVIAAVCGRASIFPYKASYSESCATSPLQTFGSELHRYGLEPAYNGNSKGVPPTILALHETTLPVYPTWNGDFGVPAKVLDRFSVLARHYGIDEQPFFETGGSVALTRPFLQMVAYFSSDRILWGELRPLAYVPMDLREMQDLPARIQNKQLRRGVGRPRGPGLIAVNVASIAVDALYEEI